MKKRLFIAIFALALCGLSFGGIKIKSDPRNIGKRYAICIGINEYEDKDINPLQKARNDANILKETLSAYGKFDYVYVMTDDADAKGLDYPKLINIRKKLELIKPHIKPEDMFVFSFSGHGISNEETGEGYLVVCDSNAQTNEDLFKTSFKVSEVVDWLKELKIKKSLMILDACREDFKKGKGLTEKGKGLREEKYENAEVLATFYATKSGWKSYEDPDSDYGVFTKYIISGLKGNGDANKDGVVTFQELSIYVEDSVSKWSLSHQMKQIPYTKIYDEKTGDLALSEYFLEEENIITENKTTNKSEDLVIDKERAHIQTIAGINFISVIGGDTLGDFYISETEISFAQFIEFAKEVKYQIKVDWSVVEFNKSNYDFNKYFSDYPVINVSRDDCEAYTAWLSKKLNKKISLPSSAQIDRIKKLNDDQKFAWGEKWIEDSCVSGLFSHKGMAPVLNGRGPVQVHICLNDITKNKIKNLSGNVREWLFDTKKGDDGADMGLVLGGSWKISKPDKFTLDNKNYLLKTLTVNDLGFRIVMAQ